MTGYYDYVLGLIPAALIGITAFLNLVGLSSVMALLGGAAIAIGLMGHAMFVNGPVESVGPVGSSSANAGSAAPGFSE